MGAVSENFVYALLLAIPIGCVSWTVTNEEIFRDMRECLNCVSKRTDNLVVRKLCYLPTCHYCFSHWVTLAFLFLSGYKFLLPDWRGYVLAEFTLVLIANVYLTFYNIVRVHLRKLKADAERAEAQAACCKKEAAAKQA
jgi:hypothetical protein